MAHRPRIVLPSGLYQPVRGFGKVWREVSVSPTQTVRDSLGWAKEREWLLGNGFYQCDTNSYPTCYVTGFNGNVYVLPLEFSSWHIWTGSTKTLTPKRPMIQSFTVDRDLVTLGDNVTLTWKTDLVSAQLCAPYKLLHSICLPVSTSGSTVISVVNARHDNDVQQFSLIVGSGPNITGEIEIRELTVAVKCPAIWFFVDPSDECARPAVRSSAIAQRFERGWMIELQNEKRIFILFEDARQGNPYDEVQDLWQPGMVETDPAILPPAGMYQPKRGLDVAWRNLNHRYREMLGWATQPEFVYDAVFQCNAGLGNAYARYYLLDSNKRVIALGRGTFYQWSILTQ